MAIKSTSLQTLVTIMWLVHLQARHFAAGLMDDSESAILPELTGMLKNVQSKQPVIYGDVPQDTYQSQAQGDIIGGGNNKRANPATGLGMMPSKKKRLRNIQNYNPIIKAKMEVFQDRTKLPRIRALCEASNIKTKELFPKDFFPGDNFCQKLALFGTCFADCTRDHSPITDAQANHIVAKLKPALENPQSVKVTP